MNEDKIREAVRTALQSLGESDEELEEGHEDQGKVQDPEGPGNQAATGQAMEESEEVDEGCGPDHGKREDDKLEEGRFIPKEKEHLKDRKVALNESLMKWAIGKKK